MKKKSSKPAQDSAIDIKNDDLMVSLGIRVPKLEPNDPSVWTKTPQERKTLKKLRRGKYGDMRFHTIPSKSIPVIAKLIICLKKNKKFPKTTYSCECYMHKIGDILSEYTQENKKSGYIESLVTKYVYNGQTYKPSERPFWF